MRRVALGVVTVLVLAACGTGDAASGGDVPQTEPASEVAVEGLDEGTSAEDPLADVEPVMLDVTTSMGGADTYHNMALTDYLDAVKEASDGLVDYEFYYVSALVPPTEVVEALSTGLADIAIAAPAFHPDRFPVADWVGSLSSFGQDKAPAVVLSRMAAAGDLWWSHDDVRVSEFEDQGLFPLGHGMLPVSAHHLICREEVTTAEQARGKQVRTGGVVQASEASNLGMEPVAITGAEMFEAMQRGVIDCVMADAPDMLASGVWEVGTDFTHASFTGFLNGGASMSKATWDELPVELQRIMWDELPVLFASYARYALDEQRKFIVEGEEQGLRFHAASDEMQQAIDDFQREQVRTTTSAPPQVEDPEALLEAYESAAEKWDDIVIEELGIPADGTWHDWVAAGSDVDFERWAQTVYEEVYLPHRP